VVGCDFSQTALISNNSVGAVYVINVQLIAASAITSTSAHAMIIPCIPVFFNLFSEAEPFSAILIAHSAHFFLGRRLRPEGPKFEAEG